MFFPGTCEYCLLDSQIQMRAICMFSLGSTSAYITSEHNSISTSVAVQPLSLLDEIEKNLVKHAICLISMYVYFYYGTGMHGLMKPTPAKSLHIDCCGPPV